MGCDCLDVLPVQIQLALIQYFLDQLSVMKNLIIALELRIFVLQGVQTLGTGGA